VEGDDTDQQQQTGASLGRCDVLLLAFVSVSFHAMYRASNGDPCRYPAFAGSKGSLPATRRVYGQRSIDRE